MILNEDIGGVMEQFSVVIDRRVTYSESMGGELYVNGEPICYTLELPWRWNQRNVSCAPPGVYKGFLRYDKADGWRIQLSGVQARSGIQIHIWNYPRNMKGCVLVGTHRASNAVLNSTQAYGLLKQAFYGEHMEPGGPVASPDKEISHVPRHTCDTVG